MRIPRLLLLLLAPLALTAPTQGALAQSKDYFVPHAAAPAHPAPAHPAPAAPAMANPGLGPQPGAAQAALQVAIPPVPNLPALPKGPAPPVAVIGVISVPQVMATTNAAQAVDREIALRRQNLSMDAQKEQATWRGMQQSLARDRAKLSPAQIHAREQALQNRITNAQRSFAGRNQIIQAQVQYALNQIQSAMIGVIRQVAQRHGMNLVLHRSTVALNVPAFDITNEVAQQMNKVLTVVTLPPEGKMPPMEPSTGAGAPPPAPPKK